MAFVRGVWCADGPLRAGRIRMCRTQRVKQAAARRDRTNAHRRPTAMQRDPQHMSTSCGEPVQAMRQSLEQCEEREDSASLRQSVSRLARQQYVERLRVLRGRDGYGAGSCRRLLRRFRRQPVERPASPPRFEVSSRQGRCSATRSSSSSRGSLSARVTDITYAPFRRERGPGD
jgi:hypothetical protein